MLHSHCQGSPARFLQSIPLLLFPLLSILEEFLYICFLSLASSVSLQNLTAILGNSEIRTSDPTHILKALVGFANLVSLCSQLGLWESGKYCSPFFPFYLQHSPVHTTSQEMGAVSNPYVSNKKHMLVSPSAQI